MADPTPPPQPPQPPRERWWHALKAGAADAVVAHVLLGSAAVGTTAWSIVEKLSPLVWAVAITAVLLAYFLLLGIQYYFRDALTIARTWSIHLILAALFIGMVMAPVAMVQSSNNARIAALEAQHRAREAVLLAQVQKLQGDLQHERQAHEAMDANRFAVYTALFRRLLPPSSIDPSDLKDLLNDCITAVAIANDQARRANDLRTAVFYRSGRALRIPPGGYAGHRLHKGIEQLAFNIAAQGEEPSDAYCQRLGIAGWCYVTGQEVNDPDVQNVRSGTGYCYQPFEAALKEPTDRAMICVPVPDPRDPQGKRHVGVLSISSLTPGVFTERDKWTARFFAMLLGKYQPAAMPNGP
jgi:hypothetical protein